MSPSLFALKSQLDPLTWIDDPQQMQDYLREWRGAWAGQAPLVLCPTNTAEVAMILRACAADGVAVVPQGGNTGLVGGAVTQPGQLLLSLKRMQRIRRVEPEDFSLTVEAGCTLADVQRAAAQERRLFPLSLVAAEQCCIGGNIASNAGGTNVLHYGNTRELVLGLEVVTADGEIWNGLHSLRKDNAGYDLKQLFIGSEGTLGVITAAVLKLFPQPASRQAWLLAVPSPTAALSVLAAFRDSSNDSVVGCELMPRVAVEMACRHDSACSDPWPEPYPWYLLLEVNGDIQPLRVESVRLALDQLRYLGKVQAVMAAQDAEVDGLWAIRKAIPAAQTAEGASIKHDISVPVAAVPDFIQAAEADIQAALPGTRLCAFGHLGDGNLHFNLTQPLNSDREGFMARRVELNALVFDRVQSFGGSIAAEHGVGLLRREELAKRADPVALNMMRRIKQALDPHNIMNPGKVL